MCKNNHLPQSQWAIFAHFHQHNFKAGLADFAKTSSDFEQHFKWLPNIYMFLKNWH